MKNKILLKTVAFFILLSCNLPAKKEKIAPKIQVITLAKTTKSWNKKSLPPYPKGQPEITILRITIPPHTALPMHKHPFINAGVMLKGALTVTTKEGKKLYLKEGESIAEVVSTWHYGKNESDTPCEIIVFYAGIKGKPITIKEK